MHALQLADGVGHRRRIGDRTYLRNELVRWDIGHGESIEILTERMTTAEFTLRLVIRWDQADGWPRDRLESARSRRWLPQKKIAEAFRNSSANGPMKASKAHTARVFRLLSLHPGSDVTAAAVAALADAPFTEARGTLLSLERSGLVQVTPGGGERWRMRDLARAYARRLSEEGATSDGPEAAMDRLLRYYQTTTEAADGGLQGRPASQCHISVTDTKR